MFLKVSLHIYAHAHTYAIESKLKHYQREICFQFFCSTYIIPYGFKKKLSVESPCSYSQRPKNGFVKVLTYILRKI